VPEHVVAEEGGDLSHPPAAHRLGPAACIDLETFDRIDLVTLAGAPSWELGVVTRDDGPVGAAGCAFLATYLRRCRERLGDPPG
jgi:hypothetical protein